MLNLDELSTFIAGTGLDHLLISCQFKEVQNELWIKTNAKIAEQLWFNHTLIAHHASIHLPQYSIIKIDGITVTYPIYIREILNRNTMTFEVIANSDLPSREKDIIMMAMASNNSFAIVRDQDNRVIWAGQNIIRFCTAPAGRWSNYDITELWRQEDDLPGERPRELQRMYRYRERGEFYIPDFEYVAYRGGFDVKNQSITKGAKAKFVSNVWFLTGHYFGEPCRLVMATHAEDI